jgi:hypothetical protein
MTITSSWDRDSSYSASITDLGPGASASSHADMDLEKAPSITLESRPGSTTKLETSSRSGTHQSKDMQGQQTEPPKSRPSTGLSGDQITAGLKDQQTAGAGLGDPNRLKYRQVARTLDDLMLSEILCIHLDERTADKLSYSLIHSFSKSQREFLVALYRKTRGQQVQGVIYSPTFLKLMCNHSNAHTFQVRLISLIRYLF